MIKKLFLLVACMATLAASAQKFPDIACETLTDKKLTIPGDMKGKRTVIALAMSAKAEKELRGWSNPLYQALLADGMGGLMGGRMYDANLCFVGLVRGIAKLATGEIKERSRKATDKKLHDNFMISEKDVQEVIDALKITNKNEPHFYVLDKDGNILYHTSGPYSDEKLNAITEKLM
jgi:ATP synthase subunit 10